MYIELACRGSPTLLDFRLGCVRAQQAIPDFLIPFNVEKDASKFYVGVLLMQREQSIAFDSKN